MNIIYSNDFNRVILQPNSETTCFGGNPDGANVIWQALPDYDPGVSSHRIGGGPPVVGPLGPMHAGGSKSRLGSVAFRPSILHPGPPIHLDPGGLMTTVCHNPAVNNVPQSQTLYLVPLQKFLGPGKLLATLTFDRPFATNDSVDPWAVGLNFKAGNWNDGGILDDPFGPTCQFSSGGEVKLNKVQDADALAPGTYAGYSGLSFTLTAELVIAANGAISGVATLSIGSNRVITKNIQGNGITGPAIKAVGIAVVSSRNSYAWVSARLLSFHLSATPMFFSIDVPGPL